MFLVLDRVTWNILKSVLRVYQRSFKGISKKFKGYSKEVSKMVQANSGELCEYFKEIKMCFKSFNANAIS